MSLADQKILLSPIQHFTLAIVVSTLIGYFYKIQELEEETVDLLLFDLRFDIFSLILIFLISLILIRIFSRRLSFGSIKNYEKWERKNPEAKLIFDQSFQEMYNEQSQQTKALKFILSFTSVFVVNYISSLNYIQLDKIFTLGYILLIIMPITHMLLFINYAIFLGMSKRIYYQKGMILINAKYALSLKQPAVFKRKLKDFGNIKYSEKHNKGVTKYTLKMSGKRKITIASSTDYEKINQLREKIEIYLPSKFSIIDS